MTAGAFDRFNGEFLVNTSTIGLQTDATITALADGGFVISWTDAGAQGGDTSGTAIRAQRYDASGTRVGAEFLVNTATLNNQLQPAITALASGGFVVSWTDNSGTGGDASNASIKAQIYNAAGAAVGGEFLVNTVTQQGQTFESITALASGGFVVTWTDASGLLPDNRGTGVKAQIFDAAGAKLGGEFLVNTAILNSQQLSSVSALASGGFVVTWTDSSGQGGDASVSGVKAQIFTATGAKSGGEFLVNTTTAQQQDQAAVTSLSNGNFVVTWRDLSLAGDTSAAGVMAQIFSATGSKVGGEFLVNSMIVNTQDTPTVVSLPGGGFAISWRDNSALTGDTSGFGVKIQVFDALGAKVGSEFVANTATKNNQEQPKITALASGAIVVSWTDYSLQGGDASGSSIKAQIFNPSVKAITDIGISSTTLSETAVENLPVATLSANGALNASYTYLLIDDPTGAFTISGDRLIVADSLKLDFETFITAEITVRVTDSFGNSFDKIIDLSITDSIIESRYSAGADILTNTATANNQQQPATASLTSGGYVVTWSDGSGQGSDTSGYGIKAQVYDATGNKVGSELAVNTAIANNQDNPAVASLPTGGFVVTWADDSRTGADTSGYGIKAQIYDSSAAKVGGEFLVNTNTLGGQTQAAVATLGTGGFVITWADASRLGGDNSISSVKAQIFDAAGAKVGGEFLVNTTIMNGQDSPAVATLESGAFVITWHDSSGLGGDTSKDSVRAQMFDAAGARIGGEVLINTETLNNQQAPVIAALDTGGYVISWVDNSAIGGDPDYYGVKAQVFDAAGARVGGEMLVNTTTANGQLQPTITPLTFGGFVIGWADYSGANSEQGTAGIKAQIYDSFGQKVGGEVSVNSETLGTQAEPAITALPGGGFVVGWTDYSGQGGDASGTGIKTKLFTPLPGQGPPPHIIPVTDVFAATEETPAQFQASDLVLNDRDASNSALTVTGVTAVSGGTVTLNADGTIDFLPALNFAGRATFTYAVMDADGFTATGRVDVNVANVNDPPVGVNDAVTIGQNGGSFAGALLLANDINVDAGDSLSLVAVSPMSSGGFAVGLSGGVISYDPGLAFKSLGLGQTATDSFAYTVSDSFGLTATATVTLTITGVDDAPTALALSNARVDENAAAGTVVGTLATTDPDNGDTFTYALTNSAGGRFVVNALSGVISVASGAVLDFETAPTQTITARSTDAGGLAIESTFVISLNDLPEAKFYTGDNGANVFTAPTNDLWTITGLGGNDTLNGNASADTLSGGAGNDVLDGRGGADMMMGGTSNDTYFVDNIGDRVIENFGEGLDTVNASISYVLDANVENLTLLGTDNLNGTGNDLTNTITGNSGDNVIDGGAGKDFLLGNDGADLLIGGLGNDSLQGGAGNDTLIGGAGVDELTGGTGSDQFVFDSLTVTADRDTVKDFAHNVDKIAFSEAVFTAFSGLALGDLPVSAFIAGTQALTADQHIIYNAATGGLFYDADGAGGAAQIQIAQMNASAGVTAQDIVLIG